MFLPIDLNKYPLQIKKKERHSNFTYRCEIGYGRVYFQCEENNVIHQ